MEVKDKTASIERMLYELKVEVSKISDVIVGNELAGDRGLIGRIERVENKCKRLEEKMETISNYQTKNSVYISQLAYISGAIALTLVGYIMKQILG